MMAKYDSGIRVSKDQLDKLRKLKLGKHDKFGDVIQRLLDIHYTFRNMEQADQMQEEDPPHMKELRNEIIAMTKPILSSLMSSKTNTNNATRTIDTDDFNELQAIS